MAGEYNSSVKFESRQAEAAITSFSGKIDTLKRRMSAAAANAKTFDSSLSSANRKMNEGASAAQKIERNILAVGKAGRSASSGMAGFIKAMSLNDLARAGGIIKSLSTHLTTASTRMRQMANSSGQTTKNFTSIQRSASGAALAMENFGKRLTFVIPRMREAAGYAGQLASGLSTLRGRYVVVGTATNNAGNAQRKMASDIKRVRSDLERYDATLKRTERSLLSFASGLGGVRNLGAAFLGGVSIANIVEMADSFNLAESRLKLVTNGFQQADYYMSALMESSNRTRTSFRENANLFTKMAQAGEAYGVSLSKTLTITENVNKAFKISGASTQESQAASMQLAQGFASGRLQGDELRSILENAPRLGRALSEELGIPLGDIRKQAKEGKIGIEELVKAFGSESFTKKINEEFANIPMTISDSLQVAKNKVMEFIGIFDNETGFSSKIANVILAVANNLDKIAIAAAFAGVGLIGKYVPAMINAVKISRDFVKVQVAGQALAITSSMTNAGAAVSLFSGVFKKSATSTLPVWKQVLGNVLAAVRLNVGSMGNIFKAFFTRLPGLAVIGTGAIMAFEDQTRISANGLATTQDYMVTGFQMMYNNVANLVSSMASQVDKAMRGIVRDIVWAADVAYKGFAGIVSGAIEAANQAGNVLSGRGGSLSAIGNAARQGASRSLGSDARTAFGRMTAGSQWEQNANDRAMERFTQSDANKAWMERLTTDLTTPRIAPPPRLSGGGGGGGGRGRGGGDAGRAAKEAEQEAKRLRDAVASMKGSFDEAEQKRNDFNEGLLTLNDALKRGVIDAKDYDAVLKGLANNTFPGLKDSLDSLNKENRGLAIKAQGGSEQDVLYAGAEEDANKQIGQIDAIIAKQGDVNGVLGAQKETILDQLDAYKEALRLNKGLEDAASKRAAQEERIKGIIQDASEQFNQLLTDMVGKVLSLKGGAIKSLFKGILGIGKQMLSQYISATVFAPLQEKFANMMTKGMRTNTPGLATPIGSIGSAGSFNLKEALSSIVPKVDLTVNGDKKASTTGGAVVINNGTDSGNAPATENGEEVVVTGRRMEQGFFAQIVAGYKQQSKDTFSNLKEVFKPVGKGLKQAADKLGINTGKLGKDIGKAIGGAQTGTMVAGAAKAIGFKKFSTQGAQIGGAIGSFLPIPGGDIIGSIIGGTIGGLLKKTKQGSVTLGGASGGQATVGKATGNSGTAMKAAEAGGNSVADMLNSIADSLGVSVGTFGNITIGQRHGDWRVNTSGSSLKIDKGARDFNDDQEGAIRYAVMSAIKKGALTGLSDLSNKVAKRMSDLDKALTVIQTIEGIKKEFKSITDPYSAAYEQMKRDTDRIVAMYKEAGATASDWAELQTVITRRFDEAVKAQLSALTAFRDDILGGSMSYKNPIDKLLFASDKFKTFEDKIAAGQAVDQGEFTSAGAELSNLARDVYGSTPEFKAYQDRLLAATDAMIAKVTSEADKYKPLIDAIVQQGQTEAAGNNAIQERLDKMIELMNTTVTNPFLKIAMAAKYKQAGF